MEKGEKKACALFWENERKKKKYSIALVRFIEWDLLCHAWFQFLALISIIFNDFQLPVSFVRVKVFDAGCFRWFWKLFMLIGASKAYTGVLWRREFIQLIPLKSMLILNSWSNIPRKCAHCARDIEKEQERENFIICSNGFSYSFTNVSLTRQNNTRTAQL